MQPQLLEQQGKTRLTNARRKNGSTVIPSDALSGPKNPHPLRSSTTIIGFDNTKNGLDRMHRCREFGCTKEFKCQNGLRRHKRTHNSLLKYIESTGNIEYGDVGMHRCGESGCTKEFKRPGNLRRHLRAHNGESDDVDTKPSQRSRTLTKRAITDVKQHLGASDDASSVEICPSEAYSLI